MTHQKQTGDASDDPLCRSSTFCAHRTPFLSHSTRQAHYRMPGGLTESGTRRTRQRNMPYTVRDGSFARCTGELPECAGGRLRVSFQQHLRSVIGRGRNRGTANTRFRRSQCPGCGSRWPAIRAKALSRTKMSCPVFVTPRVRQRRLRTRPWYLTLNHHSGEPIAPPTIDTALNHDHDSSMRTSSRQVGAEVGNALVRFFQGA